ncbi:hypothetical protein KR067_012938 [Drosophila pandora]|nr:hypothetical protein KR067_012938 [Drosophila pandora]
MFPLTKSQAASCVMLRLLHFLLVVFSLRSLGQPRLVLWLRFGCWMNWYLFLLVQGFQRIGGAQVCNLDCQLRFMLSFLFAASHCYMVANSFIRGLKLRKSKGDVIEIFEPSNPLVAFTALAIVLPVLLNTFMILTNLATSSDQVWSFHLKLQPSFLALQLQIVSFISEVMGVNIKVRLAKGQFQTLAREVSCRLPQVKQQAEFLDQQAHRVLDLKRRYSELYYLYERINDNFGGSLLIIFIDFFAMYVCHAYWLFVDVRTPPLRKYAILLNLLYIFNVDLQMTAACWHCQQGSNLGRQIGCLISKLVKPVGSKRYNDLVSEFSLQTLHQRFVVTAKDFFSLNLHLLSSMFAAVVTYLVILIQFMFAERSATRITGSV